MPRRRRKDHPGAWSHVGNRGVARRALFPGRPYFRRFLALLATCVRRGWIEVHAFCLMDNHFHLLVRSPQGQLSKAMQWLEDSYARWFNLTMGRDGPLFRGRFTAKVLRGLTGRRAVIGYIHDNPVRAGMVGRPEEHLYSSARDYVSGRGRPWLSRQFGESLDPPVLYGGVVPAGLVDAWLADARDGVPDLDRLAGARPASVRRWLEANARLADGPLPRSVLVRAPTLLAALGRIRPPAPASGPTGRAADRRASNALVAGLLRTACGLRFAEIARHVGASTSTVQSRAARHRRLLRSDEAYARRVGRILQACLREEYAAWARRRVGRRPPARRPPRAGDARAARQGRTAPDRSLPTRRRRHRASERPAPAASQARSRRPGRRPAPGAGPVARASTGHAPPRATPSSAHPPPLPPEDRPATGGR